MEAHRVFNLSVTDDQSLASNVVKFTVTMDATNDALSGTPTIDGTLAEGNTLTVNLSSITDADGRDDAGFTYQWQRSTDGGNSWSNIADATNLYYTLTRDDGLARVKVAVTHTDLGGNVETVVSAPSSSVDFSTVEGVFYDWYSHRVLHGVGISQSQDNSVSDANGGFQIDKTANDGYSFTLGVDDTGSGVDILDALLAFDIAFGQPVDGHQITAYQYYAADIDEDGDVDLSDAMSIFEMALTQPNATASEWHFIDEQVDFWDELTNTWTVNRDSIDWSLANKMNDSDSGTANFVAIQKGDVNGSWSSDSTYDDGNATIDSDQLANLIDALLPEAGPDQWWIV